MDDIQQITKKEGYKYNWLDMALIGISCSLMTILLIFLSVPNMDVNNIFQSQSEDLKNENTTIFIYPEIMDFLNEKYESSEVEFAVCLKLDSIEEDYIISDYELAKEQVADEFSVTFNRCNSVKFNAEMHSHPHNYCGFSDMDFYSFGGSDQDFSCIICDEDAILCIDNDLNQYIVEVNK